MFLKQIMELLGIQVALPIIVKGDNVGAIYFGSKCSIRTKNIACAYQVLFCPGLH
jgi:hypothetical protein